MKKFLFIDVDNTLANLTKHYLTWYNNLFIYNTLDEDPFNTDILENFDAYDFIDYTIRNRKTKSVISYEEEKNRLIKIFNSEGFWESIPLLPNADKILYELDKEYETYLVTKPSFKSKYFFSGRLFWVENRLSDFDHEKLIFCKNKSLLRSDGILIDDFPDNLINWRGKTIKVKYKFNEKTKSNKEFFPYEWEKVPDLIKELI